MTTRVLCVDDEKLIRDSLTMFFEHLGLEVCCCANGRDCLEEFRSFHDRYDLVMVNYDMPGMDGTEVVRGLRDIDARKRIALTSAYPADSVFQGLPRSEVAEFLPKPYNLAKLRRFLQRNLPGARPHVLAVVGAGVAARPWLRALAEAGNDLSVSVHTDPEEAIAAAQRGFPNVVAWELESGTPRIAFLEKLRSEEVPTVFIGSAPRARSIERVGTSVPAEAPKEALIDALLEAAHGMSAGLREAQS